jgi:hypothetical protein
VANFWEEEGATVPEDSPPSGGNFWDEPGATVDAGSTDAGPSNRAADFYDPSGPMYNSGPREATIDAPAAAPSAPSTTTAAPSTGGNFWEEPGATTQPTSDGYTGPDETPNRASAGITSDRPTTGPADTGIGIQQPEPSGWDRVGQGFRQWQDERGQQGDRMRDAMIQGDWGGVLRGAGEATLGTAGRALGQFGNVGDALSGTAWRAQGAAADIAGLPTTSPLAIPMAGWALGPVGRKGIEEGRLPGEAARDRIAEAWNSERALEAERGQMVAGDIRRATGGLPGERIRTGNGYEVPNPARVAIDMADYGLGMAADPTNYIGVGLGGKLPGVAGKVVGALDAAADAPFKGMAKLAGNKTVGAVATGIAMGGIGLNQLGQRVTDEAGNRILPDPMAAITEKLPEPWRDAAGFVLPIGAGALGALAFRKANSELMASGLKSTVTASGKEIVKVIDGKATVVGGYKVAPDGKITDSRGRDPIDKTIRLAEPGEFVEVPKRLDLPTRVSTGNLALNGSADLFDRIRTDAGDNQLVVGGVLRNVIDTLVSDPKVTPEKLADVANEVAGRTSGGRAGDVVFTPETFRGQEGTLNLWKRALDEYVGEPGPGNSAKRADAINSLMAKYEGKDGVFDMDAFANDFGNVITAKVQRDLGISNAQWASPVYRFLDLAKELQTNTAARDALIAKGVDERLFNPASKEYQTIAKGANLGLLSTGGEWRQAKGAANIALAKIDAAWKKVGAGPDGTVPRIPDALNPKLRGANINPWMDMMLGTKAGFGAPIQLAARPAFTVTNMIGDLGITLARFQNAGGLSAWTTAGRAQGRARLGLSASNWAKNGGGIQTEILKGRQGNERLPAQRGHVRLAFDELARQVPGGQLAAGAIGLPAKAIGASVEALTIKGLFNETNRRDFAEYKGQVRRFEERYIPAATQAYQAANPGMTPTQAAQAARRQYNALVSGKPIEHWSNGADWKAYPELVRDDIRDIAAKTTPDKFVTEVNQYLDRKFADIERTLADLPPNRVTALVNAMGTEPIDWAGRAKEYTGVEPLRTEIDDAIDAFRKASQPQQPGTGFTIVPPDQQRGGPLVPAQPAGFQTTATGQPRPVTANVEPGARGSFREVPPVRELPAGQVSQAQRFAREWGDAMGRSGMTEQDATIAFVGIQQIVETAARNRGLAPDAIWADLTAEFRENIKGGDTATNAQMQADWYRNPAADPDLQRFMAGASPLVLNPDGTPKRWFHGTPKASEAFDRFDMSRENPDSLYGPGHYFTEDPDTASSYATDKGQPEIQRQFNPRQLDEFAGSAIDVPTASLAERLHTFLTQNGADADVFSRKRLAPIIEKAKDYARTYGDLEGNTPGSEFRMALSDHIDNLLDRVSDRVDTPSVGIDEFLGQQWSQTTGPAAIPVYLSIKNPFDIDAPINVADIQSRIDRMDAPDWFKDDVRDRLARRAVSDAATGQAVYDALAGSGGNKEGANKILGLLGYDGITHIGGGRWGNPGRGNQSHRVMIALDDNQAVSATGNRGTFTGQTLLTQADQAFRDVPGGGGMIYRGATASIGDRIAVYFTKDSNLATAMHEPWHIAEMIDAKYPGAFGESLQTVRDHFAGTRDQWINQPWAQDALKRGGEEEAVSEAGARGLERYFREGVAPTPALQAVFEQIKQFMVSIYRQIMNSPIDVPLSNTAREAYQVMLGGPKWADETRLMGERNPEIGNWTQTQNRWATTAKQLDALQRPSSGPRPPAGPNELGNIATAIADQFGVDLGPLRESLGVDPAANMRDLYRLYQTANPDQKARIARAINTMNLVGENYEVMPLPYPRGTKGGVSTDLGRPVAVVPRAVVDQAVRALQGRNPQEYAHILRGNDVWEAIVRDDRMTTIANEILGPEPKPEAVPLSNAGARQLPLETAAQSEPRTGDPTPWLDQATRYQADPQTPRPATQGSGLQDAAATRARIPTTPEYYAHRNAVSTALRVNAARTIVTPNGQRIEFPASNYSGMERSFGAGDILNLPDRSTIETNLIQKVLDENGNVLYERPQTAASPPLPEPSATPAATGSGTSAAPRTTAATPPRPDQAGTTFKTAKGSEYTVNPDGSTTRYKADMSKGDGGQQPKADRTVYVTPDVMNAEVSRMQVTYPNGVAVMRVGPQGQLGIGVYTKDGMEVRPFREIPYTTTPQVGLHPLEIWLDPKGDRVATYHPGNQITEMGSPSPTTAAPPPAADAVSTPPPSVTDPRPAIAEVLANNSPTALAVMAKQIALGEAIAKLPPALRSNPAGLAAAIRDMANAPEDVVLKTGDRMAAQAMGPERQSMREQASGKPPTPRTMGVSEATSIKDVADLYREYTDAVAEANKARADELKARGLTEMPEEQRRAELRDIPDPFNPDWRLADGSKYTGPEPVRTATGWATPDGQPVTFTNSMEWIEDGLPPASKIFGDTKARTQAALTGTMSSASERGLPPFDKRTQMQMRNDAAAYASRAGTNDARGVLFGYDDRNTADYLIAHGSWYAYWTLNNVGMVARYFANKPGQFFTVMSIFRDWAAQNAGESDSDTFTVWAWTAPDGTEMRIRPTQWIQPFATGALGEVISPFGGKQSNWGRQLVNIFGASPALPVEQAAQGLTTAFNHPATTWLTGDRDEGRARTLTTQGQLINRGVKAITGADIDPMKGYRQAVYGKSELGADVGFAKLELERMVREKEITLQQGRQAFLDYSEGRQNPLWDAAVRASAGQQARIGLVRYMGPPIDVNTAQQERNAANNRAFFGANNEQTGKLTVQPREDLRSKAQRDEFIKANPDLLLNWAANDNPDKLRTAIQTDDYYAALKNLTAEYRALLADASKRWEQGQITGKQYDDYAKEQLARLKSMEAGLKGQYPGRKTDETPVDPVTAARSEYEKLPEGQRPAYLAQLDPDLARSVQMERYKAPAVNDPVRTAIDKYFEYADAKNYDGQKAFLGALSPQLREQVLAEIYKNETPAARYERTIVQPLRDKLETIPKYTAGTPQQQEAWAKANTVWGAAYAQAMEGKPNTPANRSVAARAADQALANAGIPKSVFEQGNKYENPERKKFQDSKEYAVVNQWYGNGSGTSSGQTTTTAGSAGGVQATGRPGNVGLGNAGGTANAGRGIAGTNGNGGAADYRSFFADNSDYRKLQDQGTVGKKEAALLLAQNYDALVASGWKTTGEKPDIRKAEADLARAKIDQTRPPQGSGIDKYNAWLVENAKQYNQFTKVIGDGRPALPEYTREQLALVDQYFATPINMRAAYIQQNPNAKAALDAYNAKKGWTPTGSAATRGGFATSAPSTSSRPTGASTPFVPRSGGGGGGGGGSRPPTPVNPRIGPPTASQPLSEIQRFRQQTPQPVASALFHGTLSPEIIRRLRLQWRLGVPDTATDAQWLAAARSALGAGMGVAA